MFKRKWRSSSKKPDSVENHSPSSSEEKEALQSELNVSDKSITASETEGKNFHHFEFLSEEIQILILSFIADTPFDRGCISEFMIFVVFCVETKKLSI